MKKIFAFLEDEGVELDEILERFSDDEDFYISLLSSFIKGDPLKELKEAIDVKDWVKASHEAHALKGVTLNLGLVNLSDPSIEMLQLFRQGKNAEALAVWPELEKAFSSFAQEAEKYL